MSSKTAVKTMLHYTIILLFLFLLNTWSDQDSIASTLDVYKQDIHKKEALDINGLLEEIRQVVIKFDHFKSTKPLATVPSSVHSARTFLIKQNELPHYIKKIIEATKKDIIETEEAIKYRAQDAFSMDLNGSIERIKENIKRISDSIMAVRLNLQCMKEFLQKKDKDIQTDENTQANENTRSL